MKLYIILLGKGNISTTSNRTNSGVKMIDISEAQRVNSEQQKVLDDIARGLIYFHLFFICTISKMK